jgi:hypothetical protein
VFVDVALNWHTPSQKKQMLFFQQIGDEKAVVDRNFINPAVEEASKQSVASAIAVLRNYYQARRSKKAEW